MARAPKLTLAKDKSRRPERGSAHGDIPIGMCEAVDCGEPLHRGDRFVTYLGDKLMCIFCHEVDAPLRQANG